MLIDPTAPFAGLLTGTPIDSNAVMTNFPTSIPGALTRTTLTNDDRGGRDVLYPAPATVICPPIRRTHCRDAGRSSLVVKTQPANPAKASLTWKWSKGTQAITVAELGNPLLTRTQGLCVYTGTPTRLLALRVPPSAAKWKARKNGGFGYSDAARAADGVKTLQLKTGEAGKPVASLKAGGMTMPVPALGALATPITVQLVDQESALCLQSVFSATDLRHNDADKLQAKYAAP